MGRPLPLLRSPVLAQPPSAEHSFAPERWKTLLRPKWVVVNGQGQEPYAIGVGNSSHGFLTLRADERCAWLAFVDLLLRSAGTRVHIPVSLCLRLQAQSGCFTMGMASFQGTECLGGLLLRVYALYDARIEQMVIDIYGEIATPRLGIWMATNAVAIGGLSGLEDRGDPSPLPAREGAL
jgi:hypothetical protein